MIKAISLDFWGTIGTFNPLYSMARTKYLSELFGCSEEEANTHYKKTKHDIDWRAEKFGVATTPLQCVHILLEGRTLTSKKSAVTILGELHDIVMQYPPIIIPEMHEAIGNASKNMTIAITSNTNFIPGSILRSFLISEMFHHFSFSDEIGVSKPHIDIFNTTLVGIARHRAVYSFEVAHIGDHPACDMQGSLRAEMTPFLVENPAETIRVLKKLS